VSLDEDDDTYGDWRIVRVRALENTRDHPQPINLPPLLLRNLAPLATSPSFDSRPSLSLVPTSFTPSAPPSLPTAVSVTLERLASPASTSKLLQKEVVGRLRAYFERSGAGRRVLKVGDLIGLGVDENAIDDAEEDGSAPSPTKSVSPGLLLLIR
jgi:hypothetical protein